MDDRYFDPPDTETKNKVASGLVFSGLMQAVKIITQFVSVVVMARLLEPSDFGLVAMVGPVYAFATLFSDLGISQATMQRPQITSAQVNTFFWINVGMGTAICLLLMALSPLVGWFYHEPRTVPLTIAMAFLVFLGSFGNQHGTILVRKMNFRMQAFNHSISAVAGLAASIVWGYFLGGYWALYAGMLVNTVILVLLVWGQVTWRPARPAIAPDTREMLRFGMGITGGNFAAFAASSASSILIGRFLGDRPLGLYDRAARLLSSPLEQLTAPISNVMVTMLYRMHDDADRYRRTFLRTVDAITFMISPGVIWAIMMADVLIVTLMGEKWQEAAAIFAPLSLSALPQLINGAAGWLFRTQGRGGDYARWSLFSAMIGIAALLAGLPWGIIGVAYASVISQFLRTPLLWWYACRTGPVTLKDMTRALLPQTAGCASAALMLLLLRDLIPFAPIPLLILGLPLSYGGVIAVIAVFPAGRESIVKNIGFARFLLEKLLRRKDAAKIIELP